MEGNEAYKSKDYDKAKELYTKAIGKYNDIIRDSSWLSKKL